MLISPIINQLKNTITLVSEISQAKSINSSDIQNLPVIFVSPFSEMTSESAYDNFVAQTIVAKIAIIIGTQNASDALENIRAEIFKSLLGFIPDSKYDAMEFDGGDLLDITNGTIWWRDYYTVRYFIRQS